MTLSGSSVNPEVRSGRRAEQKRRWDRANYVPSTVKADAKLARYRRIEELWATGATRQEIADDLGTTSNSLSVSIYRMREEGWDLPKRLPFGRSR